LDGNFVSPYLHVTFIHSATCESREHVYDRTRDFELGGSPPEFVKSPIKHTKTNLHKG